MCVDSLFSVLMCLDHQFGVRMHCVSFCSLKAVQALLTEILSFILPQTFTIASTHHGEHFCQVQCYHCVEPLKSPILRVVHDGIFWLHLVITHML